VIRNSVILRYELQGNKAIEIDQNEIVQTIIVEGI